MTWAEAEPKSTLMVTGEPSDQKPAVPVNVRGPLSTNEVCAPAASCPGVVRSKVRGPVVPETCQVRGPPDARVQDPQLMVPVPEVVPANTTSHDVALWQSMGLPPLFLMETVTATGEFADVAPAFRDTPTIEMLELVVAALTRLYTDAVTTPPTPRTAAMMMKRSMLCEIAFLRLVIFISRPTAGAI